MRYTCDLYHYGIKGQTWGVRRFQNEDGTLTAAGRQRYGHADSGAETGEGSNGESKSTQSSSSNNHSGSKGAKGTAAGIPANMAVNVAAAAANVAITAIRQSRAKKEVAESHLNDDKERITKKDIVKLAKFNKRERKEILDRMKKNPEMTFKQARRPTAIKAAIKWIAGQLAVAAGIIFLPKIINEIRNSPAFLNFMKNVKRSKIKNSVQLNSDEYSVSDAPENSSTPKLPPAIKRLTAG